MKVFKLKKSDLDSTNLESLLVRVGAVQRIGEIDKAFPCSVYVSAKDAERMKKSIKKQINKHTGFTCNYRDLLFQSQWLNFGPNESLSSLIKEGFVLVDTQRIKDDIANMGLCLSKE